MNRQCRLFIRLEKLYIGCLPLGRSQPETGGFAVLGPESCRAECLWLHPTALQVFLIMLLYLFLLCWKLTDLLETLANLAVSFTFLFYCKALHFSRMQSQVSQQKKEICEHIIFLSWEITLDLALFLIHWKNSYLHDQTFSYNKYS